MAEDASKAGVWGMAEVLGCLNPSPPPCAGSADRDREVGVAGPPPGAGLGRGLHLGPLQIGGSGGTPTRQGGHPALPAALSPLPRPQERWVHIGKGGGVSVAPPSPDTPPPPQIFSRVQLHPDGAGGGGRGRRAAPRGLRCPLPPAAAAGFGEPEQEAVSGEPLRPPPSQISPPMQIKGAEPEGVSGDPPIPTATSPAG